MSHLYCTMLQEHLPKPNEGPSALHNPQAKDKHSEPVVRGISGCEGDLRDISQQLGERVGAEPKLGRVQRSPEIARQDDKKVLPNCGKSVFSPFYKISQLVVKAQSFF